MKAPDYFQGKHIESADGRLSCQWEIPPTLSYFQGHFPHFPVLPAVAIVDISLALIQAGLPQTTWKLNQVVSAKFHRPLAPGDRIEIIATEEPGDGAGHWAVVWKEASGVAVQLRLQAGSENLSHQ
jgi:3-hydroxymyristoyl/3-hydroxydecanoyl-(acyl carrier protein) dehydratase